MKQKINDIIAQHRRSLGLTQEQLGAQLGVSGQAVSKWENGDSMPDILLLSDLCDIFGISADKLLGRTSSDNRHAMQDFCALARREGRSGTLLKALDTLFHDSNTNFGGSNAAISSDDIRICDTKDPSAMEGMGFILAGRAMQETLCSLSATDAAYFLRPLCDETVLAVLSKTSFDHAVTEAEICDAVGIDEDTADRILLGLMKRNILCCDTDSSGRRGYLQSANMVGVYMALAGCHQTNCGGELMGNIWFSRR